MMFLMMALMRMNEFDVKISALYDAPIGPALFHGHVTPQAVIDTLQTKEKRFWTREDWALFREAHSAMGNAPALRQLWDWAQSIGPWAEERNARADDRVSKSLIPTFLRAIARETGVIS